MKICSVLGIPVSRDPLAQTVTTITTLAKKGKSSGIPHYVATLNMDFLSNAFFPKKEEEVNFELLNTLRTASLVTADGMPIVWLCRLLGQPVSERIAGADLLLPLAAEAQRHNLSIYLLGGSRSVLNTTVSTLRSLYPNLRIVGYDSPIINLSKDSHSSENATAIVKQINRCNPDILILSLGNPKQELWFNRNRKQLQIGVALGLGGTLNFVSGKTARAPKWMQKTGMEWVYRLLQEPTRLWQRYTRNLFHFPRLIFPPILNETFARQPLSSPYAMDLKATANGPSLMTILTPHATLSDDTKRPLIYDLREIPLLNATLATQIVNQLRYHKCSAYYLYNHTRTQWSVTAHRLNTLLTPKKINHFKEISFHLPSNLWIDLSPNTKQLHALSPIIASLIQSGKQLHTDLLSPSERTQIFELF